MKKGCYYTHNIADELSCSKDGKFDANGFAINECPEFPCDDFKKSFTRFNEFTCNDETNN